ncbi:MAG TPA: hypothetical protein VMI35_13980 [Puia sp.]|nr:hypothetical protein [Puia sp.]
MTITAYIASFFAGMFLANAVPHFVHGISGNKFPTPFSKPRGIGLSSSTVNVLWALFNIAVGYLLAKGGNICGERPASLLLFFAGVSLMSIFASVRFRQKHTA